MRVLNIYHRYYGCRYIVNLEKRTFSDSIPPLHFRFPALPQVALFALTFVVVSLLGAHVERKSLYFVDYKLSLGILLKNDPDGSFDNRFTCYQTLENIDLVV